MNAQATGQKKQCVVCNKSGGILICEGCQKTFCGKHVVDHRQELALQLDQLMQDHDVLHHQLNQIPTQNNDLFAVIDQWETASMKKIQQAAQTARHDLQTILETNKDRLKKTMTDLSTTLRASREADDFAEQDLNQWMNKLKELQAELKRPASAALTEDETSSIDLIRITAMATATQSLKFITDPREEFSQKFGAVTISDNGLVATHNEWGMSNAYVLGKLCCSDCSYGIRFRLEKCAKPYRIFFGCISSQSRSVLCEETLRSLHVVGWFGFNQVFEHGRCYTDCQTYNYYSERNMTNDILTLVLDPVTKRIQLMNERTGTTNVLQVNEQLTATPWQFLVVLTNPGDSVRILPAR